MPKYKDDEVPLTCTNNLIAMSVSQSTIKVSLLSIDKSKRASKMEILQVPKGPVAPSDLVALCSRYRTARLRALKTYPEAFSSKYERESAFTDEQWAQRLQNPMSRTFVAVCVDHVTEAPSNVEDVEKLKSNEWVGMVVLLGPKVVGPSMKYAWDPFLSMAWMQPDDERDFNDAEAATFAVSMFVLPEAARRGVGKMLVSRMMDSAKEDGKRKSIGKLHVSLIVERDNDAAIRLYERCGFAHVDAGPDLDGVGDRPVPPLGMVCSYVL
ncbi:GNAT family acetyltransferase, putative [Trichophyton verrucosum HKI 0517]|uniref:GNAT family acetyltransferase, putative n=1 Tax=Trichophyton verrucosum (strain HKI 0517) TaxID=663202 RepID=D4D656_TRIVH|nr:GNAT family acetyltransferase, putative [Trichophyton verrucosum HKI 0517]EFE42627.1 GNAT family acetyltransferase, putative [Trichophyton verrucosum HKI 0517]